MDVKLTRLCNCKWWSNYITEWMIILHWLDIHLWLIMKTYYRHIILWWTKVRNCPSSLATLLTSRTLPPKILSTVTPSLQLTRPIYYYYPKVYSTDRSYRGHCEFFVIPTTESRVIYKVWAIETFKHEQPASQNTATECCLLSLAPMECHAQQSLLGNLE